MDNKEVLFPFENIRDIQSELIQSINNAVKTKTNLIVHAPTGLGKTVASLGPALKHAQENNLTVFFLTSRHTQHDIALETLKSIKAKFNLSIPVVDIIGKKHMCLQPNVELLTSGEFSEYCKGVREKGECEFFENIKKGSELSPLTKKSLKDLEHASPCSVNEIIKKGDEEKLCPYELALLMAKKAKVVIADYFYVFNPSVMSSFFGKTEKELDSSIIIVDEAHNLPDRMRELMTSRISTFIINQARKEAEELQDDSPLPFLDELQEKLLELIGTSEEKVILKGQFIAKEEIIDIFESLAEETRRKEKRSYLGNIASFLKVYNDSQEYVNIIRHVIFNKRERIELTHSCLDPSILTKPVFDQAYCSILMSGTLTPVSMYKDLLGVKGNEKEFPSPFPPKNKLNLIIPETTTKYSERSLEQFKRIAEIVANVTNAVPGNSAVFFPSYNIRDSCYPFLSVKVLKTVFNEAPGMSKEEKDELLTRFKSYQKSGAVLLGVATGSFGEGIDLPGDLLKCVVVVGLPLGKPDLETQALINYYDKKFGKGWDYAYTLPAISKVFQNAGRCIRTETDKGVVVFLDKRYAWESYRKIFTEAVDLSPDYVGRVKQFFSN